MINRFWINVCFLVFSGIGVSQGIIPVTGSEFPDAVVSAPLTYDGESLWGYIDGGADIYLEFGFKSLIVQDFTWKDGKIKVEVYSMADAEGAFGIYSLSVIKCLQRDTINPFDCNTRYQYQSAYGNLYISVTSESGSDSARRHYLPVTRAIMRNNPQKILDLPFPFSQPLMKKQRKSLVFIRGPIGLQNSLFPWQELFSGFSFAMYAIFIPNPDNDIYFARIRFETNAEMYRFLRLTGLMQENVREPDTDTNDGINREFKQLDDLTLYFLQSQEPSSIDTLISINK